LRNWVGLLLFSTYNLHGPHKKKTTSACWTLDTSSWQCQPHAMNTVIQFLTSEVIKCIPHAPYSLVPYFVPCTKMATVRTALPDHRHCSKAVEVILRMSKNGFNHVFWWEAKCWDKCIKFREPILKGNTCVMIQNKKACFLKIILSLYWTAVE
jgi:hypothetical protein